MRSGSGRRTCGRRWMHRGGARAFIVLEDEAGFAMTPPRARTWGRRGQTPVVRVRGRSRRRISVAALCCYRPRERSRLIYRPRFHPLLKGARKSFTRQDYRDLLVRAHLQPGAPIVVVRDNLNTHRAAGMRKYAADHEWLTIIQLPSYSPHLNPVEGIWSLLRHGWMANTALIGPHHLTRTLHRGLAHVQRHPEPIDGCLTETGLTLTPDRSKPIRKGQYESRFSSICAAVSRVFPWRCPRIPPTGSTASRRACAEADGLRPGAAPSPSR